MGVDARQLEGRRQEGRRPLAQRDLRHHEGRPGTRSMGIMPVGDHEEAGRGRRPVHAARRPCRVPQPRTPAGERRHRRRSQPGPREPDAPRGRAAHRQDRRSRTSAFSRATSRSAASAACRRSCAQGKSLTFVNREPAEGLEIFHTVTGCAAPCNRTGGISYPLANGAPFDSGELGYGPKVNLSYLVHDTDNELVPITPAAQRITYKTPTDLKPGTYTYFCRVHPFMRGAFRVKSLPRAEPGGASSRHRPGHAPAPENAGARRPESNERPVRARPPPVDA